MQKILIGTDPEYFLRQKNAADVIISAHDKIPGTKATPYKVPFGAVQVDGTAVEFNIDPASTQKEFIHNVKKVRAWLDHEIQEKFPDLESAIQPVAVFSPGYLQSLPEHAKELGCDPDFNAYTAQENPAPQDTSFMRTGSGHIHHGWTNGQQTADPIHFSTCCAITKAFDGYLYPLSLYWDGDQRRQELYGKPGAFRPKHYGSEYRVLSNAWLRDDYLIRTVFRISKSLLTAALSRQMFFHDCVHLGEHFHNIGGRPIAEQKAAFEAELRTMPRRWRSLAENIISQVDKRGLAA